MKKLVLIAGVLALGACSGGETAPADDAATADAAANTTADAAVDTSAMPDGSSLAGTYEVTASDGQVYNYTVSEDGTYTATNSEGEERTGTIRRAEDGRTCLIGSTEPEKEYCYTDTMNADGTWTSTGDDGDSSTIRRMDATATAN